jgi:hypothetical protein
MRSTSAIFPGNHCLTSIDVTALAGSGGSGKLTGEGNVIRKRWQSCTESTTLTAAIDSGINKNSEIAQRLCGEGLQILVLTHDDKDHINGAKHVLDNSPEPIRELWIPAYWMMQDRILDRIADASPGVGDHQEIEAALSLARVAQSDTEDCYERGTFSSIVDFSVAEAAPEGLEGPINFDKWCLDATQSKGDAESDPLESVGLSEHLEEGLADALYALNLSGVDVGQVLRGPTQDGRNNFRTLKLGVRELAKRTKRRIGVIHEILVAARKRKTRVRCFLPIVDVNRGEPGYFVVPAWRHSGQPRFLTFINAVEVSVNEPRISQPEALYMALAALTGLSQQNRCALVSFVWPAHAGSGDGFIVWSDSGGDWMNFRRFQVPWHLIGGMTAPHHGSDNHAHGKIWQALAQSNRNARIIVSGDLRETPGAGSRASATHRLLSKYGIRKYGVIHCLNLKRGSRFPRADVRYRSSSYISCHGNAKGCYRSRSRSFTWVGISRLTTRRCSSGCLGCSK